MIVNPITSEVAARIDSELPYSARKVPMSRLLDLLFKQLQALEDRLASQLGFDWNEPGSGGLNFAFHDGRYHTGRGDLYFVAAATVVLTANATNYIYLDPSDNTVKKSTSVPAIGNLRLWRIVTGTTGYEPEDVHDERAFACILFGTNIPAEALADEIADLLNYVTFSVGAEAANAIDVTIQVKNAKGDNVEAVRVLELWLSDSAGGWETATTPDTSVAVQAGVAMDVPTANERLRVMTNASGVAVIRITHSAAHTWFMGAKLQDIVTYSGAIAFT